MSLYVTPKISGNQEEDVKYMRSERSWDAKSPMSLASAIIYTICKLGNVTVDLTRISEVTGAAPSTITSVARTFRPYIDDLVPDWFVSKDDL